MLGWLDRLGKPGELGWSLTGFQVPRLSLVTVYCVWGPSGCQCARCQGVAHGPAGRLVGINGADPFLAMRNPSTSRLDGAAEWPDQVGPTSEERRGTAQQGRC